MGTGSGNKDGRALKKIARDLDLHNGRVKALYGDGTSYIVYIVMRGDKRCDPCLL